MSAEMVFTATTHEYEARLDKKWIRERRIFFENSTEHDKKNCSKNDL